MLPLDLLVAFFFVSPAKRLEGRILDFTDVVRDGVEQPFCVNFDLVS